MRIHEIITELTFNGHPCTKDCSGHMAGRNFSLRTRLTDPSKCRSNNNHDSFTWGCKDTAERLKKGHVQIAPTIRGDKGKFQKFQPEKPDRKKFHQKPVEQEPRNDSHTIGY